MVLDKHVTRTERYCEMNNEHIWTMFLLPGKRHYLELIGYHRQNNWGNAFVFLCVCVCVFAFKHTARTADLRAMNYNT